LLNPGVQPRAPADDDAGRMTNPLYLRRFGLALVITGAVLAGLGDGIREAADTGEANWTFLLDVAGLLLALGGAVLEARSADILVDFAPVETRARVRTRSIAAITAILVTCTSLGAIEQPILRGLAGALLMLSVGFGLGGLFSLAWIHGGGYAADRIQDRIDDHWR
jgi:hypothetical protein